MLIATFLFSLMVVGVKLVPEIPAIEIIFFRSLVSLTMSVGVLRWKKVSIWGNNRKWLIARGLVGAASLILYFITIQHIPLASAATIQYTSPIFTALIGIFLVKEKVKPVQWIFFAGALAGVFMVQGFDERVSFQYMVYGMISALCAGTAYNIIRKLNTKEHPLVIVFYFPLIALPISGIYSLFNWVTPEGWFQWVVLIMIGVLTQFAQFYMTKAYQTEVVSKIAILKYIGIIYALVFGFLIFDEHFNFLSYTGMAVVLISVILNIWYKSGIRNIREARQV